MSQREKKKGRRENGENGAEKQIYIQTISDDDSIVFTLLI